MGGLLGASTDFSQWMAFRWRFVAEGRDPVGGRLEGSMGIDRELSAQVDACRRAREV